MKNNDSCGFISLLLALLLVVNAPAASAQATVSPPAAISGVESQHSNILPRDALARYDSLSEPLTPTGDDAKERIRNFFIEFERRVQSIEGAAYSMHSWQTVRQKALHDFAQRPDAYASPHRKMGTGRLNPNSELAMTCIDFLPAVIGDPAKATLPTVKENIFRAVGRLDAEEFAKEFERHYYQKCYENPLVLQYITLKDSKATLLRAIQVAYDKFEGRGRDANSVAYSATMSWFYPAGKSNLAFLEQAYPNLPKTQPVVVPKWASHSADTKTAPATENSGFQVATPQDVCRVLEHNILLELRMLQLAGSDTPTRSLDNNLLAYERRSCREILPSPRL